MNVLIVGAGAVGKVYAYHLSKGGAKVTFLIKEKYKVEMKQPIILYQFGLFERFFPKKEQNPTLYTDFDAFTLSEILSNELKFDCFV